MLKTEQKKQEMVSKQGFKLNKKSFSELKKRLLPGRSSINAIDFISASKLYILT